MMTIADVLARLEGVHPCGGGYVARCPDHADLNASLHAVARQVEVLRGALLVLAREMRESAERDGTGR
ncbi:MAG: hypothetical protein WBE69_15880 [Candidatus Binataceae bacterium]|jgi:hypothetical protein